MKRTVVIVAMLLVLFASWEARALVIPSDDGKWPTSWPKELESLRKRAKTLDVATGTQEQNAELWWWVLALLALAAVAESVLGNRHIAAGKELA